MPRFLFPVMLLAACLWSSALALELTDLRLPLTRSEADKILSRDYSFRVLEDMTVRRTWQLENRTVSVDFSPKTGDEALLIFIDYTRPVSADEAGSDAAKIMGTEPSRWSSLNPKRAERMGMQAAEGVKQEGGRFCFRELNEQGLVVRLAYFASVPKSVRWVLADDVREMGRTAMGSRTASGSSSFLWEDEERRRGVSASSSASSLASAAAAVVSADAVSTPSSASPSSVDKKVAPHPRPKEPFDPVAFMEKHLAMLTPVHYGIAGGVVVLFFLWRAFVRARAEKRRAMMAEYIMNKGTRRTRQGER